MYWFKCCSCTGSYIVFPVKSNNTQQHIIAFSWNALCLAIVCVLFVLLLVLIFLPALC